MNIDKLKDLTPDQISAMAKFSPEQIAAIMGDNRADFRKIRENKALSEIQKANIGHYNIFAVHPDPNGSGFSLDAADVGDGEYIWQLSGNVPFLPVSSNCKQILPIFTEYSDVDFVIFPEPGKETVLARNTVAQKYQNMNSKYAIMTLADFRADEYWKVFEGNNAAMPESDAFVQDPRLKNIWYPTCWDMYTQFRSNEKLKKLWLHAFGRKPQ